MGAAQAANRVRCGRRQSSRRERVAHRGVWYRPRLEPLEPRIALSLNPTGLEQELFQLVNRFRTDPQGELSRLVNNLHPISSLDSYIHSQLQYWGVDGTTLANQWKSLAAVPPLAWSEALYDSAHDHNQAMLANDGQQHQFSGEPDPGQRMTNSGYSWQRWGENIYAYPRSTLEAHGGFVIDWGAGTAGIQDPPNHRIRLLREEFVHIGVAIDNVGYDASRSVGPLIVTQDLATPRVATSAYVVGAVYNMKDGSPWYVAGHGYGNVHIVFEGESGTFETTSLSAGGFQIQLPPGTYHGRATGGSLPALLLCDDFVVGTHNVAIDFRYPTDQGRVPVATDDALVTDVAAARSFNVLANDRDMDGTLDPATLTIIVGPTSGEVTVDAATGQVTYLPDGGFSGLDRFVYQVQDDDALTSNAATVRMMVLDLKDTPWQNPVDKLDVNLDELVTAADALQVINALNAGRGGTLQVPPPANTLPPPLLDVTGDNMLSPRDALLVINYLCSDRSGEGESAITAPRGGDHSDPWDRLPACRVAETGKMPVARVVSVIDPGESPAPWQTVTVGADPRVVEPAVRELRARRRMVDTDKATGDELFGDWPCELAAWRFRW